MEHFVGIDVSLELSSLCVLDVTGKVIREVEAGPLSQWLYDGLHEAGLGPVLLETRHVKAALSAMAVKTDRRDARGIAQLLRMGWYRPVYRKSVPSQEIRALLGARKQLQIKVIDLEQTVRGLLRGFGLKVGDVSRGKLPARIRELAAGHVMLEKIVESLLAAREAMWREFAKLHREVLMIVKEDQVCRRLMTATTLKRPAPPVSPGAGPLRHLPDPQDHREAANPAAAYYTTLWDTTGHPVRLDVELAYPGPAQHLHRRQVMPPRQTDGP
jgi:transposase